MAAYHCNLPPRSFPSHDATRRPMLDLRRPGRGRGVPFQEAIRTRPRSDAHESQPPSSPVPWRWCAIAPRRDRSPLRPRFVWGHPISLRHLASLLRVVILALNDDPAWVAVDFPPRLQRPYPFGRRDQQSIHPAEPQQRARTSELLTRLALHTQPRPSSCQSCPVGMEPRAAGPASMDGTHTHCPMLAEGRSR